MRIISEDTSLISDYEYDKKYDQLKELEKVTGIIFSQQSHYQCWLRNS